MHGTQGVYPATSKGGGVCFYEVTQNDTPQGFMFIGGRDMIGICDPQDPKCFVHLYFDAYVDGKRVTHGHMYAENLDGPALLSINDYIPRHFVHFGVYGTCYTLTAPLKLKDKSVSMIAQGYPIWP